MASINLEVHQFTEDEILAETKRLLKHLAPLGWDFDICRDLAPLTLEINKLKEEKNIVILGHSYETPDILFGVADHKGDSFGLSKVAQEVEAEGILFAGVHFMAETAKILNPTKTVYLSDLGAGCSLAESITAEDVRRLKEQYPGVPVVTYINTSADVKAESDIIVTSANAPRILGVMETDRVIFLPDKYMAANLAKEFPDKEFISWDGRCVVHEEFTGERVHFYRDQFGKDLHILVHTECAPEVVTEADLAGGTGDMIRYLQDNPQAQKLMLVTECGLVDRLRVEFPDRNFVGTCNLCPYMKRITLANILDTLRDPKPENIIEVEEGIRVRALDALNQMFVLTAKAEKKRL